jgi:nitroimidazol reductase NimA-like FMN-containing flavoprotein (pyridoxamine 5'-phosphate oxidase superfamily)
MSAERDTDTDTGEELRDLSSLSGEECRRLLGRRGVGRVVFMDTRGPVALPVNYVMDRDDIVFRTESASSILATSATGRVSFEVDEIDQRHRLGWSVLATGTVERIDDPADLRHVTMLGPTPWASGNRNRYLRLTVRAITGRRLELGDEGS